MASDRKASRKAYHDSHKEEARQACRAWYEAHREEVLAKKRADREANKEEWNHKEKTRREANKDRYAAKERAYYEANKEKFREANRRFKTKHRPEIRARQNAHRAANKEKFAARQKAYREKHLDRYKDRERLQRLRKAYGLSGHDDLKLVQLHDNQCAICKTPFTIVKRNVDHCHRTGRVRGLLCQSCNVGLGRFNDDAKLLRAALKYLKDHAIVPPASPAAREPNDLLSMTASG